MEHIVFDEQWRLTERVGPKKRYLFQLIDWDLRCIGILGARGTGKTTIMLQRLKEAYGFSDKALYISADNPHFQGLNLLEFAREFKQQGGEVLFLDEVHKYPDWSVHVKAIYDSLPDLKIVFSGSSLLQISQQKADVSRRAVIYHLHGLSFREYLDFSEGRVFQSVSLADLIADHRSLAASIAAGSTILKSFRNYLKAGYYPFFLEEPDVYIFKLREVINHIVEVDLPLIHHIDSRQIAKIKKLIYLLATSLPFIPNMAKLAQATDISRPTLYSYLEHLQNARLLNLMHAQGRGYSKLAKPEKIYLENSNLMYAVSDRVHIGTLREIFFTNQIKNALNLQPAFLEDSIELSHKGDFLVRGDLVFEVGGKNKTTSQIAGMDNAYIAADDIENGFGKKIPLWLFGFLY
ncbi:MAG: AAA family ATPase [Xanthomonadaceae bacterium]|nr:AAA family ATPase [Xanthomonadaceae bacterium]